MTSIFIDAQLRRSAVHIHAKLSVFEEFDPLNVVGHRAGTSLRDCACFEPLRQNPPMGHFSSQIREKIKRQALYFPYLARRSLTTTCTNFRLRVRLVDVINCAKFYRRPNRLRGLDS